ADGAAALLEEPRRILVEVGPGDALATMARRHPARGPEHTVISSLRHPKEPEPDQRYLLSALGRLWLAGGTVSWEGFYARERRQRTPLPTYPFERRRFWVDPGTAPKAGTPQKDGRRELADWFWVPGWKQSALPGVPWGGAAAAAPASWLVFLDSCGLGTQLVERLEAAGHRVATVRAGSRFQPLGPQAFEIDPGREEDYELLLSSLGEPPTRALHLWNVGLEVSLDLSFYSLVFLGKALVKRGGDAPFALGVVADGLYTVTGEEQVEPLKAALLGPCAVLPREHPWLTCRVLDVNLGVLGTGGAARVADQILAEMEGAPTEPVIAWRRHLRWAPHFEPTPLPERPAPLRHQGVYLITGGLGGLGLALARHLAGAVQARLVLVGRSSVPERDAWDAWIAAHGEDDRTSRRLRGLQALEEQGAEVLTVAADVTDREQMRAAHAAAEARFGAVHGVIHAAGVPGMGMLRGKTRDEASRVLAPKIDGTLALHAAFAGAAGAGLDFFVLFSSITAALPEIGQADYVAANSFLDAFARRAGAAGESVLSIGWDAWRESGMAVETEVPKELAAWRRRTLAQGLTDAEGVEAFSRVLAAGLPEVIVSTLDLAERRAENARPVSLEEIQESAAGEEPAMLYPRSLATPYMPPEGDLERQIAEVWQEILGVDKVGALDNFFELGGNSLAGIRVTRHLRERFGVSLSDVSLYEASTVRALARLFAPPAAEPVEVEDESRSRGERRRKRLAERRTPGSGA
ncbi:MAG TPA: SDR family NAD(P)-dependent oxidoreductase, partial [Thermoanaerobaculia bacterium]|nr:SDR family NAD(P)-dependent oxidoreductase [Thermoanaerobaculia bacterium]